MNKIMKQDLERIFNALSKGERAKLDNSTILLTGCAGFLGFYLMNFFNFYSEELKIKKIIGLDNFKMGAPEWLQKIRNEKIQIQEFDIVSGSIENIDGVDQASYIYHMASIASPVFYRKHPIETLDANVWGLRGLLEYFKDKNINGFVFFSSSEIYGDPTPDNIPTPETYRGYVDCQGPRACYDEAKRFGETMCFLFNQKYNMPITIVRPFNNYGPGMKLSDQRVPADFAKAVVNNRDIEMFSDGSPTRTFCYISDAVTGYIKALLYGGFETFNIGIDKPEISIKALAKIYQDAAAEVFGYNGAIRFADSSDKEYLTNNPNRRCPTIDKARNLLGYNPQVNVEQGVGYFLQFLKEEDAIW